VLQVLSSSDVAVFEGIVSDDAAGGLAGRAGESFSVGPE
jgi:hypothetical protein